MSHLVDRHLYLRVIIDEGKRCLRVYGFGALRAILILFIGQAQAQIAISPIFTAGAIVPDVYRAPNQLKLPSAWIQQLTLASGSDSPQTAVCLRPPVAKGLVAGTVPAAVSLPLKLDETCSSPAIPAWIHHRSFDSRMPSPVEWVTSLDALQKSKASAVLVVKPNLTVLVLSTQSFLADTRPTTLENLSTILGMLDNRGPNDEDLDRLVAAALQPYGLILYHGDTALLEKVTPSFGYESAEFSYSNGQFSAHRSLPTSIELMALQRVAHPEMANADVTRSLTAAAAALNSISDIEYLKVYSLRLTQLAVPDRSRSVGSCIERYATAIAYNHRCTAVRDSESGRAYSADSCETAPPEDPNIFWQYSSDSPAFVSISFKDQTTGTCHSITYALHADGKVGEKLTEHISAESTRPATRLAQIQAEPK